jgi:hypothetical protein
MHCIIDIWTGTLGALLHGKPCVVAAVSGISRSVIFYFASLTSYVFPG